MEVNFRVVNKWGSTKFLPEFSPLLVVVLRPLTEDRDRKSHRTYTISVQPVFHFISGGGVSFYQNLFGLGDSESKDYTF